MTRCVFRSSLKASTDFSDLGLHFRTSADHIGKNGIQGRSCQPATLPSLMSSIRCAEGILPCDPKTSASAFDFQPQTACASWVVDGRRITSAADDAGQLASTIKPIVRQQNHQTSAPRACRIGHWPASTSGPNYRNDSLRNIPVRVAHRGCKALAWTHHRYLDAAALKIGSRASRQLIPSASKMLDARNG